ncbi:uncharacterized protein [Littorina saxatilis]
MKNEDAGNYYLLKKTLLERCKITAESYREKFRRTRKNQDESSTEYITRISLYLDRWIEMSEKGGTVEDLKDIFLQEQILDNMPPELVTYVKDREPRNIDDVIKLWVRYDEARTSSIRKVRTLEGKSNEEKGKEGRRNEERGNGRRGYNDKGKNGRDHGRRSDEKEGSNSKPKVSCYFCQGPHFRYDCPKLKKKEEAGAAMQEDEENFQRSSYDMLCDVCEKKNFTKFSQVLVEGKPATAYRDTGSTSIIVDADLVPEGKISSQVRETTLAKKNVKETLRTAKIHLDTPYFVGETEVSVMENPVHPVLIGNKMGVGSARKETPVYPIRNPELKETAAAVTTRQEERREMEEQEKTPTFPETDQLFSSVDLKKEQREDHTLNRLHVLAETKIVKGRVTFVHVKGILYRQYIDKYGKTHQQVVVPIQRRSKVLSVGHDTPMAGHLGHKKTRERVWQDFYWPGMVGDIRRYCMSCDTCQRTTPKGRTKRVPLGKMPVIDTAFKRVAVDLIGPIKPISESKKQYILVMVDYATRYPEAVALKDIRAETVAEALWNFWTRLGIPDEILTDQGKQFTCELMQQVNQLLHIKGLTTTPWHPQANGLVERFNGTLKSMLKKLTIEQPKKWDQYLPALLFAYREVPQDSLGFSPFELLFGRTVKGPMHVLRQLWTEEDASDEIKTTAEHVTELRNRIEGTCKIARENLAKSSTRQAQYYNKFAKKRAFVEGTRVLLLLPTKRNKLELAWKGPYLVEEKINSFDYRVKVGKVSRVYHINLLRQYHERDIMLEQEVPGVDEEEEEVVAVVVVDLEEREDEYYANVENVAHIPMPATKRNETGKDVHICTGLTAEQQREVREACEEANENLTDVPKPTDLETCTIKMTDKRPVYVKPRPIPHSQVEIVEKEVKEMLELGVIEPATSAYNSPIVLVKKKPSGAVRFCNDFRECNKLVEFDTEPITDVEHLFADLSGARYFSKLDLTKGYWAIPIAKEDRCKTAFSTSLGTFQWIYMPFGLKTAGSIFNRMMRKLLGPLNRRDVHHFMDDILIASATWEEHIASIKAVLQRLKEANLAAKPSKCYFGFSHLSYLGHEIGNGKKWPEDEKIEQILKAKAPETKKELRAFLGLSGFYRSYVSQYSEIAAVLTDKTKKQEPEKVKWSPECQTAFETLKQKLAANPVLMIPDHQLPFVLRTDASDRGMGAVLMQDQGKGLQPIAYASKKLKGAEENYATVEKECLATVWGIQKFERFLYGKHFTLETDHQPLQYLQRMKPTNPRLMRWALQLQPYSFTIKVIPGKDNIGADYLSRAS